MKHTGRMMCSAVVLGAAVFFAAPAEVAAQEAATSGTAAQAGGGRGERRGGGGMYRVATELSGITAEQKEKIAKLQSDAQEKMKAARSGGEAGKGGWNSEEMQKARAEQKTQLEAILTEEQKKEFAEKLKSMGPGGGRRGERGDRGTSEPAKQ